MKRDELCELENLSRELKQGNQKLLTNTNARNDENDHVQFPKWIQVLEPTGEKDEEHVEAEKSKKFEHLEMKMDKIMEMVKKEFEEQRSQNARELTASRKGLAEVKDEFNSLRDELKKE